MADFYIRKGDRLPAIEAQLSSNESFVDLTGAAVELRYRARGSATVIVKAAAITDSAAGRVQYEWDAGDTDAAGVFEAVWRVTFSDGRRATFPNRGYLLFAITDDL